MNASGEAPLRDEAVAATPLAEDGAALLPPPPPSTMRVCLWAICILGIALNFVVFHRNNYSRKRQNSSVRNSLQILCFMAAADTISLAALLLALSTQYLGVKNYVAVAAICKIDLFLIHTSSAFSIWCWLVLSAMRYLAVYRPYSHLKLNKEPIFTTCMILVMCCVLELWILYDVTFVKEMKICGETLPDKWGKGFQLAEIVWSYFLPLTLITVLDIKVLFCHSTWYSKDRRNSPTEAPTNFTSSDKTHVSSINSTAPLMERAGANSASDGQTVKKPLYRGQFTPFNHVVQTLKSKCLRKSGSLTSLSRTSSRRRTQQMRILRRCLCISILDLGMNLPNYLVRLYLTILADDEPPPDAAADGAGGATAGGGAGDSIIFLWIHDISQLLYFAQFSLNALYLVCIIYVSRNRSMRKKESNTQQLHSLSQVPQLPYGSVFSSANNANGRPFRIEVTAQAPA